MCKKAVLLTTVTFALAALTFGITPATAAMHRPAQAMAKPYRYFMRHSFGFIGIFYRYHPGPHWSLMHAQALHLTPAQISEEKMLATGMRSHTMRGIMSLRMAYRRYREAARQPDPSTRTLIRDVREIGRAQAYLGYEMIPFHLKGYRLLDPSQRITYRRLAHENWMQMARHR